MRKSTFAMLLMFAVAVPIWALDPNLNPKISHRNTGDGELPGINVSQGQTIQFEIRDTDWRCFDYNAKTLADAMKQEGAKAAIGTPDVFPMPPIAHDEETAKYQIDVVRKTPEKMGSQANKDHCAEVDLPNRTWTIPVRTYWRLAMTGAVTGDTLTKPGFFLEAGKGPDPADSTKMIDGFRVRKNGAGQDRIRFGTAAMAHLYHPHGGAYGITWAPVSFGLGLQDNEVQYFVGSTLRFGNRAYITGGVTAGPRDRLPNGLTVDKTFVTDAKTLDTLPKKTSQGLFLSIGFSFFESNAGKLTGLIAKP